MSMHVVVIDGGVAGLAAARELRASDVAVTLIDRGFPFGGQIRPVTADVQDVGRVAFDPVPQFIGPEVFPGETLNAPLGFPPRSLRRDLFPKNKEDGLVRLPVRHLAGGEGAVPAPNIIMPCGGTRALIDRLFPREFGEHYVLRGNTEVTGLTPNDRSWCVKIRESDGTTRTIKADAVLLTQPVPEALALLEASQVTVAEAALEELAPVRYDPALAVLAAFGRGTPPLQDRLVTIADSPLALLLDNAATGASPRGPALTALAATAWAVDHFADADEEIAKQLLPLIAGWVGDNPVWHTVFRRMHAIPRVRVRMPFVEALDVPPLVLAGAAFAGYVPRPLDAVYTSAIHAVAHLRRTLSREARIASRLTPRTPAPVVVEAAVSSADEAVAAVLAGAGRLLLCAAPEVGGLTPTVDALKLVREAVPERTPPVPVTVLIRPRFGEFEYTRGELTQMQRDARRLLKAGASGIAFGAVRVAGGEKRVDRAACEPMIALAREFGREVTFSSAFDSVGDRKAGLQDLIVLGFHRLYTAGGRRLAIDGVNELAAAVGYAAWDLDVVPTEVRAGSVGYISAETGCRQMLVESRLTGRDAARDAATGGSPRFARRDHTPLDAREIVEAVAAVRLRRESEL